MSKHIHVYSNPTRHAVTMFRFMVAMTFIKHDYTARTLATGTNCARERCRRTSTTSTTLKFSHYHAHHDVLCALRMRAWREGDVACIIPLQHSYYSRIMLAAHVRYPCYAGILCAGLFISFAIHESTFQQTREDGQTT